MPLHKVPLGTGAGVLTKVGNGIDVGFCNGAGVEDSIIFTEIGLVVGKVEIVAVGIGETAGDETPKNIAILRIILVSQLNILSNLTLF